MKQRLLGTYPLGFAPVELFIRAEPGGSGEVYRDGKLPTVCIGLDEEEWSSVVAVLLHEIFELVAMQQGTHHSPTLDLSGDTGRFLMVQDHRQFSDSCARAGEFLAACLPEVAAAYAAFKKETSK